MRYDLDARRIATQKTLNEWRGRVFEWGSSTCVHLAREHMVNMGRKVRRVPKMTGPRDAVAALHKHGWDSVSDMLDSVAERIAPLEMIVGDVAVIDGQDGLGTILICAGPSRLMGWHVDGSFVLYDNAMNEVRGSWRV